MCRPERAARVTRAASRDGGDRVSAAVTATVVTEPARGRVLAPCFVVIAVFLAGRAETRP